MSKVENVVEGKEVSMPVFGVVISLIESVFTSILQRDKLTKTLLPGIFLFAYLVPLCVRTLGVDLEIEPSLLAAKGLWAEWLKVGSEVMKEETVEEVRGRLGAFMEDTTILPL